MKGTFGSVFDLIIDEKVGENTSALLEKREWSFSRITTFGASDYSCELKGFIKYVLGLEEPATLPLKLGGAVHACIECMGKRCDSSERFARLVTDVSASAIGSREIDGDMLFKLVFIRPVLDIIHGGKGHYEEYFETPLNEKDPWSSIIRGYMDHWEQKDGKIVITDWKSNFIPYHPKDTYQLGLYGYYLHKKTGLPIVGQLVFLRSGEVHRHEYTEDELTESIAWAAEEAKRIEGKLDAVHGGASIREMFPPRLGLGCEYCGWASMCRGELPPVAIIDDDEAHNVAKEIVRLDGSLKQMKESLKGYVALKGPITVDSKEFRITKTPYYQWDKTAMAKALQKMEVDGVDMAKILSLNATAIKKLEWDNTVVESLGATPKTKTSFELVKSK